MENTLPETQPKSFVDSARNVLQQAKNKITSKISSTPELPESINLNNDITADMNSYSTETPKTEGVNFKKIAMFTGIIIILAILGLNIFNYLGNITDTFSKMFKSILTFFGFAVEKDIKQIVDVSTIGTKGVIDGTTDTIKSGLNKLENTLNKKKTRNKIDKKISKKKNDEVDSDDLDSDYEDSENKNNNKQTTTAPEPDEAGSSTQRKSSKPSYCYIGEDRGVRACTSVEHDTECMSGEIFPTMELCINPNLRA